MEALQQNARKDFRTLKQVCISMVATLMLFLNAIPAASQKISPEFTARIDLGIYNGSCNFTGGVRLNDVWTVGLLAGRATTYIDAAPGHIYAINTAAYTRGYIHLGAKDIFALYGDLSIGASWVYKVTGKYAYYGDDIEPRELIHENPGDVHFLLSFEPGIRIRIYRNIHIFLGPTISSVTRGIHLGIGF